MDVKTIQAAVIQIADEFSITRAILFGSQARGNAQPDSDVDLIIEFHVPVTLITLSLVAEKLQSLLGRHVDVIHGPIRESDMIEIDKEIEIYAA